jgi:hypothetical protein
LLRPSVEKLQTQLEKEATPPLAQTRELQDSGKLKKLRHRPTERDEEATSTPEDKSADREAAKEQGKETRTARGNEEKHEEEPEYEPALGGPLPTDASPQTEQLASERTSPKGEGEEQTAEQQRLGKRQRREHRELSAAERSLASDENSLEQMTRQLHRALDAQGSEASRKKAVLPGPRASLEGATLTDMLRSPAVQQALAMAARMQQLAQGKPALTAQGQKSGGKPSIRSLSRSPTGNLHGNQLREPPVQGELGRLDLETQNALLKLQPRIREELLQGMREEGPEGYRKFIEDYFRRLSKEKGPQ